MDWSDRTVAVLASGPSLTIEDVEAIRKANITTIAVNSTWEVAPFCDVLYAGDHRWWKANADKVNIPAKRFSRSSNSEKKYDAKYHRTQLGNSYNSGQLAIEFAIMRNAKRVIMLGFDCSVKNGVHHHGKHKESPNPNVERCNRWKKQFADLRKFYKKADVVNCSRYTEINCFPVKPLENVLAGLD